MWIINEFIIANKCTDTIITGTAYSEICVVVCCGLQLVIWVECGVEWGGTLHAVYVALHKLHPLLLLLECVLVQYTAYMFRLTWLSFRNMLESSGEVFGVS